MKIKMWPSKMGATVTSGRLTLEVWEHGGVTRVVKDNSLCGYCGTHWANVPRGPMETMAAAALESWRTTGYRWSECE